jgi:hypothetical protein
MKDFSETMYVITTRKGQVILSTLNYLRGDCISAFERSMNAIWKVDKERYGWKCVKVKVNISQVIDINTIVND